MTEPCAAGAWHSRGLVCYASSGKEGNRRLPEHALYDLRSLGYLIGDGRALLHQHTCRKTKHSDQQNTDQGDAAARIGHGGLFRRLGIDLRLR